MSKREIKAAIRENARELETATGCDRIRLEEERENLYMILARK